MTVMKTLIETDLLLAAALFLAHDAKHVSQLGKPTVTVGDRAYSRSQVASRLSFPEPIDTSTVRQRVLADWRPMDFNPGTSKPGTSP